MKYFHSLFVLITLSLLNQFLASSSFNFGTLIVDEFERDPVFEQINDIIYDSEAYRLVAFPDELREAFKAYESTGSGKTVMDLYRFSQEYLKLKMTELNIFDTSFGTRIYTLFSVYVDDKIESLATASRSQPSHSITAATTNSDSGFGLIPKGIDIFDIQTNLDADSRSGPPSKSRRDSNESFGFYAHGEDLTVPNGIENQESDKFLDFDKLLKRTYSVLGSPIPQGKESNYWTVAAEEVVSIAVGIQKLADEYKNSHNYWLIRTTISAVDSLKLALLDRARSNEPFSVDSLCNCLQRSMEVFFESSPRLKNNPEVTSAVIGYICVYAEELFDTVIYRKSMSDFTASDSNTRNTNDIKRARISDGGPTYYSEINRSSYSRTVPDVPDIEVINQNGEHNDVDDVVVDDDDDDDEDEEEIVLNCEMTHGEVVEVDGGKQDDGEDEGEDDEDFIDIASPEEVARPENMAILNSPANELLQIVSNRDTARLNNIRRLYYGLTEMEFGEMSEDSLANLQQIIDNAIIKTYYGHSKK